MPSDAPPQSNGDYPQVPMPTSHLLVPSRRSSKDGLERQPPHGQGAIESDPYLAGFLAGLAAANGNGGIFEASASLPSDDSNTAWPSSSSANSRMSFLPSRGYAGPLDDMSGTGNASVSMGSQGFSSDVYSHEQPVMQPDLLMGTVSWGDYGQLLDFDPTTSTANEPPLAGGEWFQGSYGAATSSANQPLLAIDSDSDLSQQLTPGLTDSQFNGPDPSQSQRSVSGVTESNNKAPPGMAINVDQPWDIVSAYALPMTEEVTLTQSRDPFEVKIPVPQKVNVGEFELFLNESALNTDRNAEYQTSYVPPSPSVVARRGAEGVLQTVFRAYGGKRSRFDKESRIRTTLTRRLGACAICREKKLRCDQSSKEKFVPCARCARLSPRLLPGPCCRIELTDIKLFRLGSAADPVVLRQWTLSKELGKGKLPLQNEMIALEPWRKVQLTHDITTTSFMVTISRFVPGPSDVTAWKWTDANGNRREYELPPYYISDVVEATENLRQYLPKAREDFPRALLVNSNSIVWKTFKEAERFYKASGSELVETALIFWSATRMLERFWLICGTDMLGVPPMEHDIGPCRRNPSIEAIPVTPIMDTQLDELAVLGVLIPLSAKLLRLLKAKALAKKKEYWYEIYLASFIVLHNAERILDHVVDYARRFGISAEPKSNDEASLSHAYYHACKTVLAYFHFASGGAAPLSFDWLDPADTSVMSQLQIAYLRDMQAEKLRQGAHLQALKGESMYETELYWCHQLLFPGWKADMPHKGKFLEYTEKDFLVS